MEKYNERKRNSGIKLNKKRGEIKYWKRRMKSRISKNRGSFWQS
jgi:hypothetical protein